ncbi:unnamed protein product, partial [Ectocarpus sp. 8 AP-2014]
MFHGNQFQRAAGVAGAFCLCAFWAPARAAAAGKWNPPSLELVENGLATTAKDDFN